MHENPYAPPKTEPAPKLEARQSPLTWLAVAVLGLLLLMFVAGLLLTGSRTESGTVVPKAIQTKQVAPGPPQSKSPAAAEPPSTHPAEPERL